MNRSAVDRTRSGERWQEAVAAATARTRHELAEAASPRDARYRSNDPALDRLWLALGEVADPELPVSLVDLGLICDVRLAAERAEVDLTFTATACPCMAFIRFDIQERLRREPGIAEVQINEVWSPAWNVQRMTEHGRALLRSYGVAS